MNKLVGASVTERRKKHELGGGREKKREHKQKEEKVWCGVRMGMKRKREGEY
jgi:hypothetical protein